jgi:hypothetical protein
LPSHAIGWGLEGLGTMWDLTPGAGGLKLGIYVTI